VAGLVAPEFQIFTPPNALAFANGMVSLIDHGLADCDQGFGVGVTDCSSGGFAFQEATAATVGMGSGWWKDVERCGKVGMRMVQKTSSVQDFSVLKVAVRPQSCALDTDSRNNDLGQ
jgi:hypothetical protein